MQSKSPAAAFCRRTAKFLRRAPAVVLPLCFLIPVAAGAMDVLWESQSTVKNEGGAVVEAGRWRLHENSIYTALERSVARADATTGARLWVREVGASAAITPLAGGGVAALSVDWEQARATVQRLDGDGNSLWSQTFDVEASTYPAFLKSDLPSEAIALFLGDSARTIRVFDGNGTVRWQRPVNHTASECSVGQTGAVLCASRSRLSLFERLSGAPLVQETSEGYLSAFDRVVGSNDDGSFSVASKAAGTPVRRWGANGVPRADLPAPSLTAQWALRRNAGAIAYQSTQLQGGGNTLSATAIASNGTIEWQSSVGPVGNVVEAKAFGDDLYVMTYWANIVRFHLGQATTGFIDPPLSIVNGEVVGDDLIYASGGPLVRRSMSNNTLVWSIQAGLTMADNGYPSDCGPAEFLRGSSLYSAHFVSGTAPVLFDLFAAGSGARSERAVPEVVDLDESTTGAANIAARHCRVTVDDAGVVERVAVRKSPSGAFSWTLRRTDSSGATLTESAPVALPAGVTYVQTRDIERAADGSRFVQVGAVLSKLDAAGTLLWTIDLPGNALSATRARLLPDGSGGVFLSASTWDSRVLRRYAANGSLLWEQTPGSGIRTWTTDGAGGLFVAYSGNGDTIESISATGQSRWTGALVLSGGQSVSPEFRLLASDGNDGLWVTGCYSTGSASNAFVLRFNGQGLRTSLTNIPRADTRLDSCPSAMAVQGDGSLLVSVAQTYWADSLGAPGLPWYAGTYLVSASGALTGSWHDFGTKPKRTRTGWSFLHLPGDGSVIQSGRFASTSSYYITAAARRWRLPAQFETLSVELASTVFEYGQRVPLQFTLRDTNGAPVNTPTARDVWVLPQYREEVNSNGFTPATLACVIPAGASSCANGAFRVRAIGAGLAVTAFADGTAPATSPAFEGARANVVLSVRTLSAPPFAAFDRVGLEFTLTPGYLAQGETMPFPEGTSTYSYPSVSFTNTITSGVLGCPREPSSQQFPLIFRCEIQLGSSSASVTGSATQSQFTNPSNPVTATIDPVQVGPAAISLVRLFPSQNVPVGVPMAPVISVRLGTTTYSAQLPAGSLIIGFAGQECVATPNIVSTPVGPLFFGEYSCSLTPSQVGTAALTARFSGGGGLPAIANTTLANVSTSASPGFFVDHAIGPNYSSGGHVCSTTPGLTCEANALGTSSMCIAAAGWQGVLYLQPNTDIEFALAGPPPLVGPLTAFSSQRVTMSAAARYAYGAMCVADLDRDGSVTADREGIAHLRMLFGMGAPAALAGVAHACSGRPGPAQMMAVAGQQIAGNALDIDGDGRVSALTDGVLLLRYLLGLRGAALVTGAAPVPDATRVTAESIENYLRQQCALAP